MLLIAALLMHDSALSAQDFFPDTGKVAITQHALELRERLRVLSLALRPGEEDCATLVALRMGRGAQVTSAYVTNGEKSDLDSEELFPFDIAATRRLEALRAMNRTGANAVFLNLPDLDALLPGSDARMFWNTDTLEQRLRRLTETTQPDLILLMADKRDGAKSAASTSLSNALVRVCGRMQWKVGHVLTEEADNGTRIVSPNDRHPSLPLPFVHIADSVRASYASLDLQVGRLRHRHPAAYATLLPSGQVNVFAQKKRPLAGAIPDSLRGLDKQVRELASYALRTPAANKALVTRILPVLQRIDRFIVHPATSQPRARRIVLDWKDAVEALRAAALGVTVSYTLEYDVVCERQLVRLGLDSIRSSVALGAMEVAVHDVARGWVLNESLKSRVAVKTGDTLRLLSPARIDYDMPFAQYAQERPSVGRPFPLSLIHFGTKNEETFIYRFAPRIFYAPRFTAEVLTPIVRGYTGEQVITRLTNHSRDGVADLLAVRDSLAFSSVRRVALSSKEATSRDTLFLTWRDSTSSDPHLLSVGYGGVPVTQFLAKPFICAANTTRTIGVVSGWQSGALRETLRRLGFSKIRDCSQTLLSGEILQGLQVVLCDRRTLALRGLHAGESAALQDFASRGGHLVIFAQESESWNAAPIWNSLHLDSSPGLPPDAALRVDTTDALLSQPNQISQSDFQGWLNRMSYNKVSLREPGQNIRVPVRAADGMPLLLTAPVGKGTVTYVDLALGPQWMNVAPGAFRLLANMLSQ